jgi:hypothetical protein
MSVADIIQTVLNCFDDQNQDRFDKDFILSFLSTENKSVESALESLDLSNDTNIYVLTPVPAGTTDLSAWQADGQLLQYMMFPIALEWRLVGQNDTQWNPVNHTDKIIDTNLSPTGVAVNSSIAGIASWTWRKRVIYISASSVDVEIRIQVEELPEPLQVDSDTYIAGLDNVLAYKVAEKIAQGQGAGSSKLALVFRQWAEDDFDPIKDRLVKEEQTVARRMGGRRSGLLGPNWRTPTG